MNILHDIWDFTPERVYLLVALARSRENEDIAATDQPAIRKVVEDEDEIGPKIAQLESAVAGTDLTYRLYGTVNGRNAREAMHFLQVEMLDALRESEKSGETAELLKRVDHEWKSILHQRRSRDETRFLWDLDSTGEDPLAYTRQQIRGAGGEIIKTTMTPNGWHVITEPFDHTNVELPDELDVDHDSDDMVYLRYL